MTHEKKTYTPWTSKVEVGSHEDSASRPYTSNFVVYGLYFNEVVGICKSGNKALIN